VEEPLIWHSSLTLLFAVVPAAALAAGPFGLAYQLTHSVNADPTFSPDGKRLIYVTRREAPEADHPRGV
jgi:hypothetical protein